MTKKNMLECDNCGKKWEDSSPPTKESYASKRIKVKEITILLPESVVKLHHKEGTVDSHALTIEDKDFCNIVCLTEYIDRYMMGEKVTEWLKE